MDVPGIFTVDLFDCPPFRMFSSGDDPRWVDIVEHRRFEPHSMKLWCEHARSATCILDIGAHSGVYSLAAASLRSDLPIFAFEPQPYSAARLRVNSQINGFANIHDYNIALADRQGVAEIAWSAKKAKTLPSGAQFGSAQWPNTAQVYVLTLDSFAIQGGPRALVKVDVENAERYVFRGGSGFLKCRPTIILESFDQAACDEITGLLPGYRFGRIDEAGAVVWQDRLAPADPQGTDRNQLCLPA